MKYSVIIPTYNPGKQIESLIAGLKTQMPPLSEIVIVDSSTDTLVNEVSRKYAVNYLKIDAKDFDHGGTRNLGVKNSEGDLLMFLTHDILPVDEKLFIAFDRIFNDTSIGGAYARQLPRLNAGPVEQLSRLFSYPEEGRLNSYEDFLKSGVKALYFANPCACVRRSVFNSVGGFPERIICNEDMVMAYKILKAGYKTAYASEAQIYHSHNYSPVQLFKRYFDIGCFFESYPELKSKAKNSEEGFSQTIRSFKVLIKNRYSIFIPKLLIETIAKLLGYKAGEKYRLIPGRLKKLISMNKNYWEKNILNKSETTFQQPH